MADAIAVLNAGSSSIKFSLFVTRGRDLELELHGQIEGIYTAPHFIAKKLDGTKAAEKTWDAGSKFGHDGALDYLITFLKSQIADDHLFGVGHRVLHGGIDYKWPVIVDERVASAIEKLIPLAPLHQPHNLAPIRRLLDRVPELPQVACFDTSFHTTNPNVAQRFALPEELYEAGVRRYGFHGLSYEYIASVLGEFDATAASGKVVVLHLGSGASMCAMESGRSVATTMGFTAIDGLPMGTRTGTLDPGVVLYLMDQHNMDARAIEKLLYNQSGLLGVSGLSSDMRQLLDSSDTRAKLAIDLYCYRIRREVGSLAAALGGLDAIVFTGGIGENSAAIRERVCRDAAWLGVELDASANTAGGPRISTSGARVSAWTIPTNEELMIARHTRRLLN
ncbi:MAG TPA: acetate/propionate family kinase [Pyrinomonadaceae bacterium]|jgi:acetate kinase|nr:acetate/propionate family kinase [Pyrinomonadaceae bacterium]